MSPEEILSALRAKRVTPDEARVLLLKSANGTGSGQRRETPDELGPESKPERADAVLPVDSQAGIAIIGMSGRYASASDLDEYWRLLELGLSGVREIPNGRWDMERYYDPAVGKEGGIYCRWMGMLDDVECFDSGFFAIPPSEAEMMDPMHRLLLEEGYGAFEDAGYTKSGLDGSNCGVYVGMSNGDYHYLVQEGAETPSVTSVSNAVASARLAYYLNLKGPALTIDTACSSSLVAIHTAVRALQDGEIDMALAGGVSLYLNPESYVHMCEAGMLSPDGACKAFDNGADGIVVGEGAGAVVLKRRADAERDGDYIYGLISASGINQDGKTNGITAPSLDSQESLVRNVYERYGIDPGTIDYAELHGTGTKLGDPIELEALANAFRGWTPGRNFCAIGSVKSNVGHMSAAAGVAGLHKVLLSLRYSQLPATLNVRTPNEHFDFSSSPFVINTEATPWAPKPGRGRRACLSSFGFSGTNAHIVIDEYIPANHGARRYLADAGAERTFVLSATTDERLAEYAQRLAGYLGGHAEVELDDVAYTLQTAREPMRERLAIVASDRDHLIDALRDFAASGDTGAGVHRGTAKATASHDVDNAEGWVRGVVVEWSALWEGLRPRRIPLPTYPFEKERHWYPRGDVGGSDETVVSRLHPLVHENVSDFTRQRFRSTFTGAEQFFAQHRVHGEPVLPGAAVVELALAAGAVSAKRPVTAIAGLTWEHPLRHQGHDLCVEISLAPLSDNAAEFELRGDDGILCAGGRLELTSGGGPVRPAALDLSAIRDRCTTALDVAELYSDSPDTGVWYGPVFRVVRDVVYNRHEVLATLELSTRGAEHTAYTLHPALLDGAWQAIGPMLGTDRDRHHLPFSVQSIRWYTRLPERSHVHVRAVSGKDGDDFRTFDITITGDGGDVVVELAGFTVRPTSAGVAERDRTLLLTQRWDEAAVPQSGVTAHESRTLVLFAGEDRLGTAAREHADVQVGVGAGYTVDESGIRYTVRPCEGDDLDRLVADLWHRDLFPDRIVVLASDDAAEPDRELYRVQALCQALTSGGGRQVDVLYLHMVAAGTEPGSTHRAMGAYFRCLGKEEAFVTGRTVGVSCADLESADLAGVLRCELSAPRGAVDVWWDEGTRKLLRTVEVDEWRGSEEPLFRDGGVYLITGGLGGLGLIFARHLASRYNARLVLTGRRALDDALRERLRTVSELGAEVLYVSADVSSSVDVADLVAMAKRRFGAITGVLHAAGVVRDGFIRDKRADDVAAVLAPKVAGTWTLDEALRDEPLDCFVVFSSMSAVLGNAGQSDYCYANAYQDGFAETRERLRRQGRRTGRTLSIGWPYWTGGGMAIDPEAARAMREQYGIAGLDADEGCRALEQAARLGLPQLTCVFGKPTAIRRMFDTSPRPDSTPVSHVPATVTSVAPAANADGVAMKRGLVEYLTGIVSERIKTGAGQLRAKDSFETFGIDSIIMMSLTRRLEADLGELPKTLFFEYRNIDELADYFLEQRNNDVQRLLGATPPSVDAFAGSDQLSNEQPGRHRFIAEAAATPASVGERAVGIHDIAIIGISGRYPDADDLDQFWANLTEGIDSIREVPDDRWDHSRYYDPDGSKPGRSYAKWGGFLGDVDKFDPLFFNISPAEADFLDPQARLFLQTAWHAVEDAGYPPSALAQRTVGVYVGVMHGMYELLHSRSGGEVVPASSSFSAIANRVSYFLDVNGPSMAVDTMCSSSLTTIHLGCESIRKGESDMVIAGGVNLILHPNKYLLLSQGRFASTDGRCRSFGADGDGYVPGEGVGAVVLKSLERAIEDGDNIHAVLKGSSVNSGGRTTGFTVPNPKAQADLVRSGLRDAGIDARTVSYVEAHGTGTALGDPIEVSALTKAFGATAGDPAFCAIGSVKSNIGHLESAAGIAALTKVVLQLRHRKLVPSLHSATLNPHIDFESSPFTVQRELAPWHGQAEHPRRAGVSSFGAGGANAHLVVEEYPAEPTGPAPRDEPLLFVFSAKEDDRLRDTVSRFVAAARQGASGFEPADDDGAVLIRLREGLAAQLGIPTGDVDADVALAEYGLDRVGYRAFRDWVRSEFGAPTTEFDATEHVDLAGWARQILASANGSGAVSRPFGGANARSVAYTLQVGREPMERRLAVIADDITELTSLLARYLDHDEEAGRVFTGNARSAGRQSQAVLDLVSDENVTGPLLRARQLDRIAALWVEGVDLNWGLLHEDHRPQRVSLPGYSFAAERCWVSEPTGERVVHEHPHPLLHRNTSDLDGTRFSTTLTGNEFFLSDHRIGGEKMLPAVVYLEMALCAVRQAMPEGSPDVSVRLRDVVWLRPLVASGERTMHITLNPGADGAVDFRVHSASEDGATGLAQGVVHCQGTVEVTETAPEPTTLDPRELRERCAGGTIAGSWCYGTFARMGVEYGPAHQAIETVYCGRGEALVALRLPRVETFGADGFTLHPALLDSTLQATLALALPDDFDPGADGAPLPPATSVALPYAVDGVDVLGPMEPVMWAHLRELGGSHHHTKVDIALCTESGRVAARLSGVTFKDHAPAPEMVAGPDAVRNLLLAPRWRARQLHARSEVTHFDEWFVFVCDASNSQLTELGSLLPEAGCRGVTADAAQAGTRYREHVVALLSEIQAILRQHSNDRMLVQVVAPADREWDCWAGLSGFLRTVRDEHPSVSVQVIQTDDHDRPEALATRLRAERALPVDQMIRYEHSGHRTVQEWTELAAPERSDHAGSLWRSGGVYLVTGGAGGLGLLMADAIATTTRDARLVLTGRSDLDADATAHLDRLRAEGAAVEYVRADIADAAAMTAVIVAIERDHGALHGVLHCAGVTRDRLTLHKEPADAGQVLAPKTEGLVTLDELTTHLPLEFFLVFSSVAGAVGNVGQADYAAGNAFMDHYAAYRNELVARGERQGRTLSVGWQLWQDGGLRPPEDQVRRAADGAGLDVLDRTIGLDLLERCAATGESHVVPMVGDTVKLREYLRARTRNVVADDVAPSTGPVDGDAVERLAEALKVLVSDELRLEPSRIETYVPWEEYGVDSVLVVNLTQRLERHFGPLSKTIFFENQTLGALAGALCESHPRKTAELLDDDRPTHGASRERPAAAGAHPATADYDHHTRAATVPRPTRAWAPARGDDHQYGDGSERRDIAIVGVAGRYPQADDLDSYWANLRGGVDCVTEIPGERWDHSPYYSQEPGRQDRTYAKWGGFIDDAACFDPLFFNISPGEAEIMDPQERIFLECVHHALEDAGYTRHTVSVAESDGLTGRVGVFVGVMYQEYQLYAAQQQVRGEMATLNGSAASIANRVSYTYGFHGPSLALDTMCSSSLVALHNACQSLRTGECTAAIAGGVNLSLHPNKFLMLGKRRFASTTGRCASFGQDSDGYAPGEGVGAVLLKPLALAEADGDHIYGVIKGTAVNHDGKTNGYTVPNPVAQTAAIRRAVRQAGVDPAAISYLEAHGTGTRLGDAIEISALTRAFRAEGVDLPDRQYCYLGSVKSNIGHGESASGIAAITKVLLQMRYGEIVPSLHSTELNPEIDFAATPFTVPQEVVPWSRPVVGRGGVPTEQPRIAGVFSFGAGGTNAHIMLAEHRPQSRAPEGGHGPVVVPLSARNDVQLRGVAERLSSWLRTRGLSEQELADVAYTLQVGRDAFEERLGFVVSSQSELQRKLDDFLAGRDVSHRGHTSPERMYREQAARAVAPEGRLRQRTGDYGALLDLWVVGEEVDWAELHTSGSRRRISLPTYPFARQQYWAPGPDAAAPAVSLLRSASPEPYLDPLLHRNRSSFFEQRFTTTLTGRESFLEGHRVGAVKVLPASVLLEMARRACAFSFEQDVRSVRDVVWSHPIEVGDAPVDVTVWLYPDEDSVVVHIGPDVGKGGPVCMRARIDLPVENVAPAPDVATSLDLVALIAGGEEKVAGKAVYAAMADEGLDNRPEFQVIDEMTFFAGEALAQLSSPWLAGQRPTADVLHPALVNGAFQSVIALLDNEEGAVVRGDHRLYLPLSVGRIEIREPLPDECAVHIRRCAGHMTTPGGVRRFDLTMTDRAGAPLVIVEDFAVKPFDSRDWTGE